MNNRLVFLQKWLEKRSQREKLYLFISGFVFLYLFFYVFFLRSINTDKKDLLERIAAVQAQQGEIQEQIDKINALIKTPIFLQMFTEQKKLTQQLAKMQQQIDNLKPTLFSAEDMPILTKKILDQQRDNVVLISLVELPVELWSTQKPAPTPVNGTETVDKNVIDDTTVLDSVSGVYQHTQQIEFRDDYFSTISYLKRLEKISRNLYWDSMDYKVLQYPKANVVIKFHVLSLQKS